MSADGPNLFSIFSLMDQQTTFIFSVPNYKILIGIINFFVIRRKYITESKITQQQVIGFHNYLVRLNVFLKNRKKQPLPLLRPGNRINMILNDVCPISQAIEVNPH